ncbi:MAG: carbohydrate binding domain-containing protein [Chitinispirillaceae bacterium]|nr:carbohydrate binding domain-containing protein [Chitinispirillaceae bacterium]
MNRSPVFIQLVTLFLLASGFPAAFAQALFEINPDSAKSYISPAIYGVNTISCSKENITTLLPVANLGSERIGGNRMTGYNWENNASSAGSDWNHSSDAHLMNNPVPTVPGPGGVMVTFLERCRDLNMYSTVQLPMAGYVSADMNGAVAENEVAPSSRWKKIVFEKNGPFALNPVLTDSSVFIDEFINFMVQKFGKAAEGGVRSYCLDNEPGLWKSTHPRIHPQAPAITDLIDRSADLAAAVKAVDPSAEILGLEAWGWMEMNTLASATGWDAYKSTYDWGFSAYLGEMKKKSDAAGKRLLDVATVHWYPEARGDARICNDSIGTESTIQARLQAPRSLWDSTYKETSWIADNTGSIYLLTRLFKSIAQWYPDTKLGITEYTYGGAAHVSGGLALADVLGIFGSKGVYVANLHESVRKYLTSAFLLYQNFDGKYSTYGDTSVAASSPSAGDYSVYASIDSKRDKLLHAMLINKKSATASVTVHISGLKQYQSGIVYGFTSDSSGIARMADVGAISNNTLNYNAPGYSALHFILSTDATVDLETPAYYNLAVTTLGNGKVLRTVNGARLAAGTPVTLTAVPDSGWIFSGWAGADSSTNASVTVTMNGNKTIEARFTSTAEMIPNGDFSNDIANWSVSTWSADGSAQGSATVVSGVLTYVIANGGAETWNIQIFQNTVPYINGITYTLSFDAWAEASRSMNVYAAGGALAKTIALTTTKTAYTYTFTADSTTAAGRLSFDFGGNGVNGAGVAYLDNVSMKIKSINPIRTAARAGRGSEAEIAIFTGKGAPAIIRTPQGSGPLTITLRTLTGRTVATLYRGKVNGMQREFRLNTMRTFGGKLLVPGIYLVHAQTRDAARACRILLN